ncbi:ankyrin repeat domain-containing protein 16-like isoform X2 [Periplaneta americana]
MIDHWNAAAYVNQCNRLGKTPLHEAAQASQPSAVQFLLEHGADTDILKGSDWTPLMLASTKKGCHAQKCVKILLENHADRFLRNKDGWTALHVAAKYGDVEITKILLDGQPLLANVKSNNGRYPLHVAALNGHEDIVHLLLDTNATLVSSCDDCGSTPLLEACKGGNLCIIQHLLRCGASSSEADAMGLTCLHLAAQTGNSLTIQFLRDNKLISDINIPAKFMNVTPLHCAARAGQLEAVRILLQMGADTRSIDINGRCAYDMTNDRANGKAVRDLLTQYQ